jgi:hypothetical protein
MGQSKQLPSNSKFGHWMRVTVMCLSGGFIFPNAMTEDDDIVKVVADEDGKANTKQTFNG